MLQYMIVGIMFVAESRNTDAIYFKRW